MASWLLLLPPLLLLAPAAGAESRPARTEADVIAACLASWGDHPFQGDASPRYRVLSSTVTVFGIGEDVVDETVTEAPQLVLIKPAVNVLGKATFRLLNPNGWYCFESAVTVLAKSAITAHCRAHLASSVDGVSVAAGNRGADGVTVLGKAVVTRVGCDGAQDAPVRDDRRPPDDPPG